MNEGPAGGRSNSTTHLVVSGVKLAVAFSQMVDAPLPMRLPLIVNDNAVSDIVRIQSVNA